MSINVGPIDRTLRVAVGLGLLSLVVLRDGRARYLGLLGLVPLLTAALGRCPLYTLLALRPCAPEDEV